MEYTDELIKGMESLNAEQSQAVETIDGPLLVVAGPGTGKTQILSLRAANILASRDVRPENILCLTYTEAGAEAMRDRLIQLIGRDAYGIEVCTFHGFAQSVRSRYPQYFKRNPLVQVATELQRSEILDHLLKALPFDAPLSGVYNGAATGIDACKSLISKLRRSGLSTDEFRAILQQDLEAIEYLSSTRILELASKSIPRKAEDKQRHADEFELVVESACREAPAALKEPVIQTPGIYVPFIIRLGQLVSGTELIDEDGKASGFTALNKILFEGAKKDGLVFKDEKAVQAGLVAADVIDGYWKTMEERDLIDFDDMIADCIQAIENSDSLRLQLQERYQYIQVDEFQDTNGAQMRIVDLLCQGQENPNVMTVGDDDQAIMRFQGASVLCIEQFQEKYNPSVVVLKTNYRSTPSLVDLGQKVACQVEHRLHVSAEGKAIEAFKPEGSQTRFVEDVYSTPEEQYLAVAQEIRDLLDSGFVDTCKEPDKAIAVLACKHSSLRAFIPYLKALDIPFAYRATSELLLMDSMQTLFALLRFVAAYSVGSVDRAQSFLPSIVGAPEFGCTPEEAVAFMMEAKTAYHGDWVSALQHTEAPHLKGLWEKLLLWSSQAPNHPVRQLIYDIALPCMRYQEQLGERDPLALAEFNSGIRALMTFAEEETGGAHRLGHTLRLADVVARLDKAEVFEITIEAGVGTDAPGAVRLTTAHSSKGLEFDKVFLLDADEKTWHKSDSSGTQVIPSNVLLQDERDADDVVRLLFVALTRPRSYLTISRASGETLRELQGLVETRECACDADELARAIKISWMDDIALDTPALKALVVPRLERFSLSASSLNEFVTYKEDGTNTGTFLKKRVLCMPEAPSISMEFGSLVHSFLEEYIKHGALHDPAFATELEEKYRQLVGWMDFEEEELARCGARFDRICRHFLPQMGQRLEGTLVTESFIRTEVGDSARLNGKCDLLMIGSEGDIQIVDYKTGFDIPTGEATPEYGRQLRFYRLLVENSPEYQGHKVTNIEDWYVEPEKGTIGSIHSPIQGSATDEEIEQLMLLINAVWHRVQTQDFDTSAFEESTHKASALARSNKNTKSRMLQAAYEDWLIAEDLRKFG